MGEYGCSCGDAGDDRPSWEEYRLLVPEAVLGPPVGESGLHWWEL
jgi:hypothetical protein